MNKLLTTILIGFLLMLGTGILEGGASFWGDDNSASIPYCDGDNCSFDAGVDLLKSGINDIVTDRSLSQYIQDIVTYLLSFVTIVGVIYIIYAGFQLMIGGGEEEKLKKAKNIITYIIIGIVLMWLAYSIMAWILQVLNIAGS